MIVLNNIRKRARDLRSAPLQTCADHVKDTSTIKTWTDVLAGNGEVAVAILRAPGRGHDSQNVCSKAS